MSNSVKFSQLAVAEQQVLSAQLNSVRAAIEHAGEKGRVLEHHILHLLRAMLPGEYGLTTGFIAYRDGAHVRLSSQLDIIIYDAIRGCPLIHLGTCDVIPLEAAYAYVEVKARVKMDKTARKSSGGSSFAACLSKNADLRKMRKRRFVTTQSGSPPETALIECDWLAIRAFVVAFEVEGASGKSAERLAHQMSKALTAQPEAHIHGLLVPSLGFFYTPPHNYADSEFGREARFTADDPLLVFKRLLLRSLTTFGRPNPGWTPAIETYFESATTWAAIAAEIEHI